MKTYKYKLSYADAAADFLRKVTNSVAAFTDEHDKFNMLISRESDSQAIHKILGRAYTVLAKEGEEIVGMASMDKDGSLFLLSVPDGDRYDKVSRYLLGALEKIAEDNQIHTISVLPTQHSEKVLIKFAYLPFEGGSEDEDAINGSLLVKYIESVDEKKMGDFSVKRYKLDPNKRISIEEYSATVPCSVLGIASLFVVVLIAYAVFHHFNSHGEELPRNFKIMAAMVSVIFAFAIVYFSLHIWYLKKLKQTLLTMDVTNAVITDLNSVTEVDIIRDNDGDYKHDMKKRVSLTYSFYDADMRLRHGSFSSVQKFSDFRFFGAREFYKGQEILIVYNQEQSYILRKSKLLNTVSEESDRGRK